MRKQSKDKRDSEAVQISQHILETCPLDGDCASAFFFFFFLQAINASGLRFSAGSCVSEFCTCSHTAETPYTADSQKQLFVYQACMYSK